jgi:hypothetical protein
LKIRRSVHSMATEQATDVGLEEALQQQGRDVERLLRRRKFA